MSSTFRVDSCCWDRANDTHPSTHPDTHTHTHPTTVIFARIGGTKHLLAAPIPFDPEMSFSDRAIGSLVFGRGMSFFDLQSTIFFAISMHHFEQSFSRPETSCRKPAPFFSNSKMLFGRAKKTGPPPVATC